MDTAQDVVGLYLNPPDQAVVLWVDQKRQSQALERTQPMPPWMVPLGKYWRSASAATPESLSPLQQIEGDVPSHLDIHLSIDN